MSKFKKQITFDLDTKALKIYYPNKSWNNAYDIIKKHMTKNDFLWLQGSVYVSIHPMSSKEVTHILYKLIEDNKWLNLSMRDCRETNIEKSIVKTIFLIKL